MFNFFIFTFFRYLGTRLNRYVISSPMVFWKDSKKNLLQMAYKTTIEANIHSAYPNTAIS